MASIRIPFPEKDEPGVVLLQGPRVTVGRLPFNTLQIIDRTVSGFHAELILDGGHYRLHDRGSTNGTFVNGEPATDFHLREACKISFGTVECEFDPAAETSGTGEAIPTRDEINSVRQENATLRTTLAAVREEVRTLRDSKPAEASGDGVAREEFTKVVAERQALTESEMRLKQEVAQLKGEIAVLRRDRENLQKAWDATKAELSKSQPRQETAAEVKAAPAPISPPAAASVPSVAAAAPTPPIPLSRPAVPLPKPPSVPVPASGPAAPVPAARPAVPAPAPTVRSFPAPPPAAPPARLVPVTAAPAQTSTGVRPFPRPVPPGAPAAPAVAAPRPPVAPPKPTAVVMQPRASAMPSNPPPAGPKGTQKIG
jgi:pSer/pThr/pTyr-binding forkhead associated (FHA) protein